MVDVLRLMIRQPKEHNAEHMRVSLEVASSLQSAVVISRPYKSCLIVPGYREASLSSGNLPPEAGAESHGPDKLRPGDV